MSTHNNSAATIIFTTTENGKLSFVNGQCRNWTKTVCMHLKHYCVYVQYDISLFCLNFITSKQLSLSPEFSTPNRMKHSSDCIQIKLALTSGQIEKIPQECFYQLTMLNTITETSLLFVFESNLHYQLFKS
jgi:hypothetical protein